MFFKPIRWPSRFVPSSTDKRAWDISFRTPATFATATFPARTVPCFLLQPIVENAIRHGIANSEAGGSIVASARRYGDRLRISVRDSGPGTSSAPSGNGIALKNTRERLAYFYPEQHRFHAGPLRTGGFEVAMDVPSETAG
jgi:LytS/YehU family sensor histidine kinase